MIDNARVLRNATRAVAVVALLVGAAATAQSPEDGLESRIATTRYPLLAEQARIQGEVHLKLSSGIVTVISGHPLLARPAEENTKQLRAFLGRMDADVTYHFVIVDTNTSAPTSRVVKRGNVFERAVLRMFGRKTEKVVLDYTCEQGVAPPGDVKMAGSVIEIWIYGRTWCLQANTTSVVAER